MKKYPLILLLLTTALPFALAEDLNEGAAVAGTVILESEKTGGALECAFPLVTREVLFIRNAVFFSGLADEETGYLTLGDKIMFGGKGWNNTKSYGFLSGSVGTAQNDDQSFFTFPLFGEIILGGGFEMYTSANNSFSVEAGGGLSILGDEIQGFAHTAISYRIYFP